MSKKNSIVLNHKKCFSKSEKILNSYLVFEKKISKLKFKKFLVAVSGGADSLALAAMCKVFQLKNQKKTFYYVHINHGIRKNSLNESKRVQNLLKKQFISLKVIENKNKFFNNIQHNARKVRYDLLNQECKKKKIKLILTGHHKDDQIETFLIRLSRGSGVQGLSGMRTLSALNNDTKIFRPLLEISKKELIFTAKKVFGSFIKDPSNKNKRYLRTKIRNLLPLIKKFGINENQIIKSIDNLRSSSETLNLYINDLIKKTVKRNNKKYMIDRKVLFSLNSELQLKILGFLIKKINKLDYPPRSKKIFTALNFLDLHKEKKYKLGGCALISRNNKVVIQKA